MRVKILPTTVLIRRNQQMKDIPKQKAKRFAQDRSCYSALSILIITVTTYEVPIVCLEIYKMDLCYPMILFKKSNSKLRQFIVLHLVHY